MNRTIQSILVPLDGSPLAEQAIPLAQSLAQRAKARLKLVVVHSPHPLMEPGLAYAQVERGMQKADSDYLASVTARVREQSGDSVSSALVLGIPVGETLSTYSHQLGADLIVMTTHGRGGLGRAWLGSVADHLIRTSEIPVLVVRPGEHGRTPAETTPARLLVALDGSSLAEAALGPAAALALLWRAEIRLVRVVPPVGLSGDPLLPFPLQVSDELTQLCRQSAQSYLARVAERLSLWGITASGSAVVGDRVPETLIEQGATNGVGLIVTATHGRGGLRRLMLGSVADKLVRGAETPVLVIRPPATAALHIAEEPASAQVARDGVSVVASVLTS